MIEGEDLSTCFEDSGSSSFGELESGNCQLGNVKKSQIISHCAHNNSDSISILNIQLETVKYYCFWPRCLTRRLSETGGLLTLEASNLLRTVLAKAESVLLERNLKSYTIQQVNTKGKMNDMYYSDEKVVVKILAL